ncbi:MAG TPA: DUF1801 domain-containing protein [Gemmatimonadaceae bacterium]|nr:DUF1801 domain-containing protein [Gemmatimonadaceae bacterium]
MAENKTKETSASVSEFLDRVDDARRRQECLTILELMRSVTNLEPKMWGSSMVGFGSYHYKYESGREGDYFLTGFSPRKQNLTLYLMSGFDELGPYLTRLGKHKTGKSCLYIDTLDDVDMSVLRQMIEQSVSMKESEAARATSAVTSPPTSPRAASPKPRSTGRKAKRPKQIPRRSAKPSTTRSSKRVKKSAVKRKRSRR